MTTAAQETKSETKSGIDVRVTEISAVVRTLEIEVDGKRVERAFERAYRDLGRKARVRGFRPGKVPRSVLERLYGPSILEDVERGLVAETLPEAVAQAGLRPVAEPTIEAQPPADAVPFRYSARIEVKPVLALPPVRGLPAVKPDTEVRFEEVEEQLETLRQRQAPLVEEPEGTAAARGNVLSIDFVGRRDGQPFEGGTGQDVELELGSGRFIPGFEEQLEGARTGDDRELRVRFPDTYGNAELAGKEVVFQVHVAAVKRRALPELDDEFAKDVGDFSSLAELRARIQADLQTAREREADAALKRSVLDALLARAPFDVPPGMVDRRLQRRLSAAHRQLESSAPHDALHQQLERWAVEWRPLAEREVREALLLEAVAAQEGLTAEEAELETRLEAMAKEQGIEPAKLRKAYQEADLLEAVRVQILDEKALDLLVREARIEAPPAT
jgi:trigger factor